MKKYLIILLLLIAIPCLGADSKITELTEDTTPTSDDLLVTVDAPGSSPVNKKATIGNVIKLGGTIANNVTLDDGTTDSPSLIFQDSDDETVTCVKKQGGDGSGYLQCTTAAGDGFQILTGNLKVGNGTPGQTINGEDAYIEGLVEVDGMIYADGGVTGNVTGTASGNIPNTLADAAGDLIQGSADNTWAKLTKGAQGTLLQAGATVHAATTYAFPTSDCSENQILKANSSGDFVCAADATGAGGGDVESAGDCTSGACLDGSSDGGTYIRLYDGTSAYSAITAGVRTLTLAPSNANAENMTITFGDNNNTVAIASGTGAAVSVSGNAGTATALAADPADCAAGQVATGIAASGALSCTATPTVTTLTGNVTGNVSGSAGTVTDAELAAIQELTFADASIIQLTGAGAASVLTSGGNNYFLMSNSDNTALQFATPAQALTGIGGQASDADLTTIAGLTPVNNKIMIGSASPAWEVSAYTLADPGSSGNILKSDGTNWTSSDTITITTINLPSSDESPGTTAGQIRHDSTVTGLATGAIAWYDGDEVRYLVDLDTLPSNDDYVVAYDADNDKFYMKADANSGGSTAINDIGDAAADGSISVGGYETTITSTLDEANHSVLTITNTDADTAADTTFITLKHNDGADANVFYVKFIGDADGTPTTDLSISQTTVTSGTLAWDLGGATSLEIPNGANPTVDATGEIALDTDGANVTSDMTLRVFDGTNTVAMGRKLHSIQVTVVKPQDLADAVRDAFLVWSNDTGMTFTITSIAAWSGTDDTTLNVEETDADGANNATIDAVEIATNGTGVFTQTETTITGPTIEAGHLIWIDFDDTDDPSWVKLTITGWFNAAVD